MTLPVDRLEIYFVLDGDATDWGYRAGWPGVPRTGDFLFLGGGERFLKDRLGQHLFVVTKVVWNTRVYIKPGILAADVYIKSAGENMKDA